ncbi:hypothetical protein NliqN6_4740 [Naganishia liquefaciens]|uniref:COP9 signalosome complex subunit 6 n=1 Tax=Naganishia liquefaciens TaxID=104408 RepID=A0A8H3TWW7_9TREE|nr:hypothetical protein NliqN6_4740 [Naganishia liquefaciens]
MATSASSSSPLLANQGNNSGLAISLHPLPILSISEHYTRDFSAKGSTCKVIGGLLGTQSGREVSITNSFELALKITANTSDVDMEEERKENAYDLDKDFLETRREQFKQVFPTLDLIGWYSIGPEPTRADIHIQHEFASVIETPIFLQLSPSESETSPSRTNGEIPVRIFQSALGANDDLVDETSNANGIKFVELKYAVETGEAERIAVDGAAKAGGEEDGSGGSARKWSSQACLQCAQLRRRRPVVTSLTTQRNAVAMLYERMQILLKYIAGVINSTAQPDHSILRQVSAIVSTLPVMTESGFREEFLTEYSDVQLTSYLANMTKTLATLNDLTDRFNAVHHKEANPNGRGGNMDFSNFMGSMGINPVQERKHRR